MPRPRGDDWLEDEIQTLRSADVDVLVSLLTPEEVSELGLAREADLCHANEIEYYALPIEDRGLPPFDSSTFEFLGDLAKQLSQGRYVVIHCRQGIGRASVLAASLLIIAGVGPEEAFDHLASARGRSGPDTEDQRKWVYRFADRVRSTRSG